MHPAAAQAARELASLGIPLITLEEAAQILDASALLPSPDATAADLTLGTPVRVGNLTLHPPTIAAIEFLLRLGTEEPLAMPFALAFARNPDKLDGILTREELRRELADFRRRAGCTQDELLAASALAQGLTEASGDAARLEELERAADLLDETNPALAAKVRKEARGQYRIDRGDATAQTPITAAAVLKEQRNALAHLAALCGVPPDHWRGEEAAMVWQIYRHALESEAQRSRAMASAFGADTSRPNSASPAVADAVRAMRKVILRIANRHKAELKEKRNG